MKFFLYDLTGRCAYLQAKLVATGHTAAEAFTLGGSGHDDRQKISDVIMLDCDWWWAHPRPEIISRAAEAGSKIVLYPHAGMPTCWVYDGLTDPDERVHMRLEHGQGSVDITRLAGHDDINQRPVGWLFSPTAPFRPVENPKKLLFAPLHPNIEAMKRGTNGHDPAPKINQAVFRDLLKLPFDDVTVSLVGPSYLNGVWQHPRTKFFFNPQMSFPHSYQMVAEADVVVGGGTIAAAAVALGKPTVMIGQGDFTDYIEQEYRETNNPSLYENIVRYPIDAADGDLDVLIAQACEGRLSVSEWREQFIGSDGTDNAVRLLEELVGETDGEQANYDEPTHVTVQGVVARAGSRGKV